jgi:hypothetical protein
MMRFPAHSTLFLILFLILSGCSSTTRSSYQKPVPATTVPGPIHTVSGNVPAPPSGTPPVDPIIGSWLCYSTRFGERLEKVYTYQDDNTWTRIDRNLKDRTLAYSHGTWKNRGKNQYPMRFLLSGNSGTFRYDAGKEELYNPDYEETYHRTADPGNSPRPVPVINLTLNSEQKVYRLGNFRPFSDKAFLIVNVTIRNSDELEEYSLDEKGIHVVFDGNLGISPDNAELGEDLENPFRFGTLAPGETRQGDVLFAVPDSSHTYALKLVYDRGDDASNIVTFGNSTVT